MTGIFQSVGKQQTLVQQIVDSIENKILSKELSPGQKMPSQKELCEMFSVSNTALREALQKLSAKGLIDIKKGSGIYINNLSEVDASQNMDLYVALNFDQDYALHLIHLRQALEPLNARQAAIHRTDEDLQEMAENLVESGKAGILPEDFASLDVAFHRSIAKASANPLTMLIMNPLFNLMPKIKALIVNAVRETKTHTALNYHTDIYRRIKAQDPEGAFEAMKTHLKVAEEDTLLLIEVLEKQKNQ